MTNEAQATQADPKAKAPKEPKAPVRNISAAAREHVLAGLSNQEALDKVKAEFPEGNTTLSSIAWYRNDLRKKGHDVPSPKKPKAEKPAKAEKDDGKSEVKAAAKKGAKPAADFE